VGAVTHHPDDVRATSFYRDVIDALTASDVAFLVGGTYAMNTHACVSRETKDLDLFLRREDWPAAAAALERVGIGAELTFPHWLGKAHGGDRFVDLVFGGANGVARVDDGWFAHASPTTIFGAPALICPAEEMIWSKAFLMERERYDGADVAHLIRGTRGRLDWTRLLGRFGADWRVLLAHVSIFGFIYPGERDTVPAWVTQELASRLAGEAWPDVPDPRLCRGTLLSRAQYVVDLKAWRYVDARVRPHGPLTADEAASWTAAADDDD
jgi:hypothetical protein